MHMKQCGILVRSAIVAMLQLVPLVACGAIETNVSTSARGDEHTSWDSIFVESNQIPFSINFYNDHGFYYELVSTREHDRMVISALFSEQTRLTGRLGVKLQVDVAAFKEEGALSSIENGIDLRRFRITSNGRSFLLSPLLYGVEFGLTGGKFYFNDGYLWFREVPYVGSLKAGLFKAPMSFEGLESSSVTTLMEVSSPISAFAPSYKFGLQLGDAVFDQRATVYGGWYADAEEADSADASSSYNRWIGRATWLPVDNSRWRSPHLLHLGISGAHMFANDDGMQFRSRPESYLAPYMVDTGKIRGDQGSVLGLESAWLKGPFSMKAELMHTTGENEQGDTFQLGGFYVSTSWVLTGESRAYNRDVGVFKGIIPHARMSFKNRTWGAWEWAARFSHIDLNDGTINGGMMDIVSTGLNCYLSKRTRLMLNLGYADVKESANEGDLLFLQSRFQLRF
jgi:phosphate-selective porin OprO/OprP